MKAAREVESLREQLEGVNYNTEEVEVNMKTLRISLVQVETEHWQSELSMWEREQALRLKSHAVELLPGGAANLAKLQLMVESRAQRVFHLAESWNLHDGWQRSTNYTRAAKEAQRKEEVYKQLLSELETLARDVSRLAYTQCILEIVGNIRKQKEEIIKILLDTNKLQKEINSLFGKLDRTYAVTDELVFKDAKKDDAVRKAYKYLAALHENCSQLIQTMEDTGTIIWEVRDLEEQIETEVGKKTLSKLEKICKDYRALCQENTGLLGWVPEA
ncbi:hypothetical protein GH733_005472 [Mirounga leonina]|nr:hypothetical protein GH733_005472 [Mirounga leonina]